MVRECRPPARDPTRSWLARRSTMATSTHAKANSPANISPVGPPPTITTACSVIATLRSSPRQGPTRPHAARTLATPHAFRDSVGSGFSRRLYRMTRVLKQAPCAPHIKGGSGGRLSAYSPSDRQSGAILRRHPGRFAWRGRLGWQTALSVAGLAGPDGHANVG